MGDVPQWHLTGDWFDVCSCNIPCPCEFAQAPTNNHCEGVLAWHIRKGSYGGVKLDGLNVVAVGGFEGNLWTGEGKAAMGMYTDDRADPSQRGALEMIFGGRAGGWPAGFAQNIGDRRGIASAPIKFELAGDLAHWRVEVTGKLKASAEALGGPTTPTGKRVQTINPPGSEVGPGQVATWAKGNLEEQGANFGFTTNFSGKSSKHIPFDWSGPGQG